MSKDVPAETLTRPPNRKPPIWPWVVVLILVIGGILVHRELTLLFDDLQRTGRDLIQLFEWLLSFFPEAERAGQI
ncbi:hypothetical protein [Neorhizobium sp. JUb45]|uniref:hypothetical protein n=1 Tax=Neorhizobium sp. JUb45 TaxID=2485113 RepID=UPI0010465FA6|nr:hypothetical protein [Neorhizobium sp. JUb45]